LLQQQLLLLLLLLLLCSAYCGVNAAAIAAGMC
jgi:hypothetical protein